MYTINIFSETANVLTFVSKYVLDPKTQKKKAQKSERVPPSAC